MRSLVVVLLLLAACASTRPLEEIVGHPASCSCDEVVNFGEVAPGIYRGAQPDAAGFKALHDLGVKTIVDLQTGHDDTPLFAPKEFDVVRIPIHAGLSADTPSDEQVRAFFDVVTDEKRKPVFVHCAQGKDRTGTMCALYRMEVEGWTPERAIEEMHAYGYHSFFYGNLQDYVRQYKPGAYCPQPAPVKADGAPPRK
jgi:tyrosine-protein phosphatase SIW14